MAEGWIPKGATTEPALDPFQQPAQDPFQQPAQDPFQVPTQDPAPRAKNPGISKTKAGLLVLVVGILFASVSAPLTAFLPTLLDPRLAYVAPVALLAGAALVFVGRRAWPEHRRSALAGLALVVAGEASATVLAFFGTPYFQSFQGQPTGNGSPYHNAYLLRLAWDAASVALVTAGILLLVWKITSDAPRRLIVAGNLIFLAYYLAGSMLSVVLYDPSLGGVDLAAQPAVRLLVDVFLPIFLVTNALVVLGLVVARWRLLPSPHAGQASPF